MSAVNNDERLFFKPSEDINTYLRRVDRVMREASLDFGVEPKVNRIVRFNITGDISKIVEIKENGDIYLQSLDYFTGEPQGRPPYKWNIRREAGIQQGKGSFTIFKAENFKDYEEEEKKTNF